MPELQASVKEGLLSTQLRKHKRLASEMAFATVSFDKYAFLIRKMRKEDFIWHVSNTY